MNLDLAFYWGLLLRRLPVMLALFLVCALFATISALKLPPTYSTTAQLLVEEAQIPTNMVADVVQTPASQQLQVIEQRLLTRVNLLNIARKFNVFEDIRTMTPDEIVSGMRSQTRIWRSGDRRRSESALLMRVTFRARSGQIAANVVNEYVTLILQESIEFSMSRVENTLAFFEQEVQRLDEDLGLQSALLVRFKNENSGALPSDLTFRQNRQTLLQERQSRLEREIAALQKQRGDMVTIFESTGQVDDANVTLSPEQQELQKLEMDLQRALAIYSETNPRIVLLRSRIDNLKGRIQENAADATVVDGTESRPATMLELTLADLDQRVASLQEELSAVTDELAELEVSIQATAANAIQLEALERDFQNIQSRYSQAVGNLNRARVSERIELSAQGQRVSVLENANVPQEPSGPNRFKLIFAGAAAGLGLAIGFFLLLEFLNRSIRRPFELQSKFGIIPLAIVPYMESRRDRIVRRSALATALVAVLVGVPAILWYIDTSYMPLDILANRVFDRLGLT